MHCETSARDSASRRSKASRREADRALLDSAAVKATALELVSSAIMMVDRDFVVTFANATSLNLLRNNAEHFKKLSGHFDPDKIIGTCIDIFHKNPAHQRRMLADDSKLPHHTEITRRAPAHCAARARQLRRRRDL